MGGDWGVVMSWQDAAAHRHTWIVPREMVHGEPHVIAARLESQGLRCNFVKASTSQPAALLASVRPDRRLTAVTCGGWHGMNFVLPDGTVFGDGNLILRPEMVRADLSCASRGSLQDWQDQVARYAVGNSRIAFFLAAGVCRTSAGIHQPNRAVGCICSGHRGSVRPRQPSVRHQSLARVVVAARSISGGIREMAWRP